jgi:protein-S-isoprenylcysteine O-methyltransferase Ste14
MAGLLKDWVPPLDTPAPTAFATVGIAVIWVDLAVRVWAEITVGGSFRTSVEVEADQAVVTNGPYRWVRHAFLHRPAAHRARPRTGIGV